MICGFGDRKFYFRLNQRKAHVQIYTNAPTHQRTYAIGAAFIIIFCLTNNAVFAQLKVYSNNHVKLGYTSGSIGPSQQLMVSENTYFQCLPATSGLYFENFQNQYVPGGAYNNTGSTTYNEPAIKPQWGNAAWLGTVNNKFWQVRSFEVWSNNVLLSSDSSFKSNIQPLDSAISLLAQLHPVTYDHSAGITDSTPDYRAMQIRESGKNSIGLLAQDVQTVLPQLVRDSGNGELAVNYMALIPVLIQAIKEQQMLIEGMQREINTLKK